ncbi:aminodeoxychorismate synthase component I [Legionella geestiana]|nr:aminodeoxychorismate synthase component I [Legionella geestiana]
MLDQKLTLMMQESTTLPQIKEIPFENPMMIFERFHEKKWAFLFDSALEHPVYGRYSYIALEPCQVIWVKDGELLQDGVPLLHHENPFQYLKAQLHEMTHPLIPDLPPFQGGLAGAFSYDLYQYLEKIPMHALDDTGFPDMAVGFYDVVISFDNVLQKAWIVSTGYPEKNPAKQSARALQRLHHFLDAIQCEGTKNYHPKVTAANVAADYSPNFEKAAYIQAIKCVQDYILAGDIFETNISQRFSGSMPEGVLPFELYKILRTTNPAPFAAFLNLGDFQVVSASPERFLRLHQGFVETRPIKGTRPRGDTPESDRALAESLKNSEKDNAENVMIVDLLRNDLSRVCKDHSVKVTTLCGLETYPAVHHLVSVITGELCPDCDALDLLQATFPGGSITGAPKIRAMEIIAEIEPTRRGIYCGSLGFIGFNGCMDTSIAIRTCTLHGNTVNFQAGGAIVADSCPESEYQETLVKARPLIEALGRLHDIAHR